MPGFRALVLSVGLLALASCGNAADSPPPHEPTAEELADMYQSMIGQLCAQASRMGGCQGEVRVSESFATFVETEELVPIAVRDALTAVLPDATFGSIDQWMIEQGDRRARGIILMMGPSTRVRDDVIGIEGGYLCGNLCGSGNIFYFWWNGLQWLSATADELGLPNVISVS